MRKLLAVLALLATSAWAGEQLLGVILVSDGGTANNASTGYGSAGCVVGGACYQAFRVPAPSPLSVQCDQAASVVVNKALADAGEGIQVGALQFLTTSTAVTPCRVALLPDGGSYVGGCVAIAPAAGAASATCRVWSRQGNE